MGKVKPTKILGLLFTALCAQGAIAGTYSDSTANNSFAAAADVTSYFSIASSPDIGDITGANTSLSAPWVSISGVADAGYKDYFRFSTASTGTIILDIDHTYDVNGFNSRVDLWSLVGGIYTKLGYNDTTNAAYGAGGSATGHDAFLQMNDLAAGTYIAEVNRGNAPLAAGENYTLQIQAPVPEPETYAMMLAGLGLMGTIARRRKSNRTVA